MEQICEAFHRLGFQTHIFWDLIFIDTCFNVLFIYLFLHLSYIVWNTYAM